MFIELPIGFLPADELLLSLGACALAVAPFATWAGLRLRAARAEAARWREELAEAREELAGAYGGLRAAREALAQRRQGDELVLPAADATQLTTAQLQARLAALQADVARLAADARRSPEPVRWSEAVTPH
jgi:uncharacterized small protein (DUF1192 family)